MAIPGVFPGAGSNYAGLHREPAIDFRGQFSVSMCAAGGSIHPFPERKRLDIAPEAHVASELLSGIGLFRTATHSAQGCADFSTALAVEMKGI
jgi:hypothetical protein